MLWGGPERRKSVRVQIRMTIQVQLQGQPRFYEAISLDLSMSGSRLLLHQHLPHCTPVYLEFRLPGALQNLYCPAHVVWCQNTTTSLMPGSESTFLMGVEFTSPPRDVRKALKRFIADRLKRAPQALAD